MLNLWVCVLQQILVLQIEFMVACMQFINIVVHSVDDMNYRVALQWEFASLGLEEYLEKLRPNESEELSVQISGLNPTIAELKGSVCHSWIQDPSKKA